MATLTEKYLPVSTDESDDPDRHDYRDAKETHSNFFRRLFLTLGLILGQVVLLTVYTAVIWHTISSPQAQQAPGKGLPRLFPTEMGEELQKPIASSCTNDMIQSRYPR